MFSVAEDDDYLRIIHGLKYNGFMRVGREFGRELGFEIKRRGKEEYGGIVPVPIHHARLRERGFNQSLIIAQAVSEVLDVPLVPALKRIKYTTTQTQLSKSERTKNIRNTIVVKKNFATLNGAYLLIDDVLTTGSTMNAAATALLNAGASRVDCGVLAVV